MTRRLVYICDWLPPDFGAVGQYAMLFARQWAKDGWAVTLVGLTSGEPSCERVGPVGDGLAGLGHLAALVVGARHQNAGGDSDDAGADHHAR